MSNNLISNDESKKQINLEKVKKRYIEKKYLSQVRLTLRTCQI